MDQAAKIRTRKEVANTPETVWVFDLDNILYPERCNLFANIDVKMKAYISRLLDIDGDTRYVGRVLEKIGIESEFEGVFDIGLAVHTPKPDEKAHRSFIRHFDVDPERAVMIEDMARNLTPAAALGMTTVWVKTGNPWGQIGYDAAHINYETADLVSWLEERL